MMPVSRSADRLSSRTGSQSEDRYWTISGLLHYFPVACSVTYRSDGSVLLCGNSTPFKSSNRFEFCEGPLALVHKGCRRPAPNTSTVAEKAARLSRAVPELSIVCAARSASAPIRISERRLLDRHDDFTDRPERKPSELQVRPGERDSDDRHGEHDRDEKVHES